MPRPANPSAISTWISKPRALVIFSLHAIHKLDLTSCLNLSNVSRFSASNDYLETYAPTPLAHKYRLYVLLLSLRVDAWRLMA